MFDKNDNTGDDVQQVIGDNNKTTKKTDNTKKTAIKIAIGIVAVAVLTLGLTLWMEKDEILFNGKDGSWSQPKVSLLHKE